MRASGHETLALSTAKFIQTANQDQEYKNLIQALRTYKNPKQIPAQNPAKKYSPIWEKMSIQETECGNVIVHNNCSLIIPKTERKSLLNQLHQYHTGADKAYNLAKQYWYWPAMKAEIEQMIDNCNTCQIHQRQKPGSNLILESTIADLLPHQQLNMDYGHWNGKKLPGHSRQSNRINICTLNR